MVDFNPQVREGLKQRGIRVIYGDISQRDTLVHAGIEKAEILVCTVPDSILKGISNIKLVRQLRQLNPEAKIIAPAELLSDVEPLYRAGADYVTVGRLHEAGDVWEAMVAAESGLLSDKKTQLDTRLLSRKEILS